MIDGIALKAVLAERKPAAPMARLLDPYYPVQILRPVWARPRLCWLVAEIAAQLPRDLVCYQHPYGINVDHVANLELGSVASFVSVHLLILLAGV
jgi:hypothetical protein